MLKILSNYTVWDKLSQKTISRYCPFKDQKLTHLGDEEEALLADILHIWRALHDGFHSGQRQQDILGPTELKLIRLLQVMTLN